MGFFFELNFEVKLFFCSRRRPVLVRSARQSRAPCCALGALGVQCEGARLAFVNSFLPRVQILFSQGARSGEEREAKAHFRV